MVKSRILAAGMPAALAAILAGCLALGFAPGAFAQSSPAAQATQPAAAKESLRTRAWNKVSGNWKRMKGSVKARWGKLTNNEIREAQGRREALNGFIQSRYGIDRETADRQIDDWLKTLK
jgi:uncharacterized protein YjbJ (UPF0337 family)